MGTGVSELEKSARWSQQRLAAPVMAGPPLPQSLPWGCIWTGGGGALCWEAGRDFRVRRVCREGLQHVANSSSGAAPRSPAGARADTVH